MAKQKDIIQSVVTTYLSLNPPQGGITLDQVKADTAIAGAISHKDSAHAPNNAQKNSDITKEEIEAKLTGELTSHTHASSGGLTQAQILTRQL